MNERSLDKLFVILDMYDVMRELQTEFGTIFVGESCSEMLDSAVSLTKRLAQTAQKTYVDFEESIENDAIENIPTNGTIHHLTSYVVTYINCFYDYQSTLKQISQEFKREDGTDQKLRIHLAMLGLKGIEGL